MFQMFKKKKSHDIGAVVSGVYKPLCDVDDAVFSQGLIGQGVAIMPSEQTIYAPVSGTLSVVFPTGHAFGITSEDGIELLIHIGVDTVNLKGEGFTLLVEQGTIVEQGTPLVKVDFDYIREQGYACDTMLLVTNPKEAYDMKIQVKEGATVTCSQVMFRCEKH